jgi:type IV pilus biogenesis protein CpaD/CtpE
MNIIKNGKINTCATYHHCAFYFHDLCNTIRNSNVFGCVQKRNEAL